MSAKTNQEMSDHKHEKPEENLPEEDGAEEAGRDLKGAVEEAREIVDFTAQKVRDMRELIASIHSPFLNGLLAFYVLTGVIGTGLVVLGGFRDWYMFLAMYTVVLVFLLLYIKAHFQRRLIAKGVSYLFTTLLMTYWIFVLNDRIPARRVWRDGEVVMREHAGSLWIPMVMTGIAILWFAVHFFLVGRYWEHVGPKEDTPVMPEADTVQE